MAYSLSLYRSQPTSVLMQYPILAWSYRTASQYHPGGTSCGSTFRACPLAATTRSFSNGCRLRDGNRTAVSHGAPSRCRSCTTLRGRSFAGKPYSPFAPIQSMPCTRALLSWAMREKLHCIGPGVKGLAAKFTQIPKTPWSIRLLVRCGLRLLCLPAGYG
jgi:hypothetical protein